MALANFKQSLSKELEQMAKKAQAPEGNSGQFNIPELSNAGTDLDRDRFDSLSIPAQFATGFNYGTMSPGADGTQTMNVGDGSVTVYNEDANATFRPPNPPPTMTVDETRERLGEIFGAGRPITLREGIEGNFDAAMKPKISYEEASAIRSDSAQLRPNGPFDPVAEGLATRDRDGLTMEAATRLAEGNRNRARAMIEIERQGINPLTGQPIQNDGLSVQEMANLQKTLTQTETERLRQQDLVSGMQLDSLKGQKIVSDMEAKRLNLDNRAAEELNAELSDLRQIVGQTENVTGVGRDARNATSAWTAGFLSPLRFIGGTAAADLEGNLEVLKSDAFIKNITEMRKASPTGGAVGNVSDRDLVTLQSLQTSLMQKQSPSQLRDNIQKYVDLRNKVALDAKRGFINKYGEAAFEKYFEGDASTIMTSDIVDDVDVAGDVDSIVDNY